jgi:HAE1 family hydrophobic/amphiphilic exporter-1
VIVQGRLAEAEQFENVIVKTGNAGEITRLRDVGRAELGAQTYGQIFRSTTGRRRASRSSRRRAPNAPQRADRVDKRMKELRAEFPRAS